MRASDMASGVCVRCGGKYLAMGHCNGGPVGGDAFQPKGMNWLDREFGPLVDALHDRHTACLSCGLVCSEVLPDEMRELVERKGLQRGTASGVHACVRCAGQDLIDCICGGSGKTIGYGFRPDYLRWFVLVIPSLSNRIARPLYEDHVACLSCGLVWFEVHPEELRELIERNGTEQLKRLLPPADTGAVACDEDRSSERPRSGPNPRRRVTSAELLATANPVRLLDSIRDRASARKLRLLTCGCVRAIQDSFVVQRFRQAVEVAERFADGLATADELRAAREGLDPNSDERWIGSIALPDAFEAARRVIPRCLGHDQIEFWAWERQRRRECRMRFNRLVADVFYPLLSGPVAFDASWRTSTAVALAQQMYDSRELSIMPILADALQDAGCDSDGILNHCRDPEQPHVRGCWVVDLLLGRE